MTFTPFKAPSHTQTPNELIDEWLPLLTHVELKVLLVLVRKTFGWHKIRDRISLSQLEKMTGSTRSAIIKAINKLLKVGLIMKFVTGKRGTQETVYELVVIDDSNSSYQSSEKTGGSLLRRPTKETITKERKRAASAAPKKSPKAPAASFSDKMKKRTEGTPFQKIDILKLIKNHGEEEVLEALDYFQEERKKPITNPGGWLTRCLEEGWWKEKKTQGLKVKKNYLSAQKIETKYFGKLSGLSQIEALKDHILFSRGQNTFPIFYNDKEFEEKLLKELKKMGLK